MGEFFDFLFAACYLLPQDHIGDGSLLVRETFCPYDLDCCFAFLTCMIIIGELATACTLCPGTGSSCFSRLYKESLKDSTIVQSQDLLEPKAFSCPLLLRHVQIFRGLACSAKRAKIYFARDVNTNKEFLLKSQVIKSKHYSLMQTSALFVEYHRIMVLIPRPRELKC